MVFAGITFLYWFLPAVVILYFISPKRLRNSVLLLSGLVFYGWGEPKTLPLLVFSILIGYGAGLGIGSCRTQKAARIWMWISVAAELSFLLYFKYADFFIINVNRMTGLEIPLLRVLLPVGISFYTFQIISYLADVYRGSVKPQKNIIDFAMYVCLFTQLVAGPIIRYTDMEGQMKDHRTDAGGLAEGIRRVILGLSKKVLLADVFGEFCQQVTEAAEPSVLFLWLSAIAFTLQIYFDFSGYSDMAIGLGRIFGFQFPENFRYPYCAESITEFWRRWHISLGTWFRDYVYIPLGGNRCKPWKWMRNILIVWLLTGFWHGAEWNFLLWGLYFAVILVLEKLIRRGKRAGEIKVGQEEENNQRAFIKKVVKKVAAHGWVILLVVFSFVIFQETDLPRLGTTLCGMLGLGGLPWSTSETWYYFRSYSMIFLLGLLGCTPLCKWAVERMEEKAWGSRLAKAAEPVILAVLLLAATAYLVNGTFHPFLYFRF